MNHYFTNENLASDLKKISISINDKNFNFYTDKGVFSKNKLDFGSRTLLNQLLTLKLKGSLLDVGCGYGVMGIILSSFFNINVDMIDINKRAIHLALMNIKENKCKNIEAFISNGYEKVEKKYDYIITNPPIRAGLEVVYEFLFKAKDYLKEDGELYFVMNKDQGAKRAIKDLGKIAKVNILDKNKGFYVICVKF